jgi:hypothetical protein
MTNYDLPSHSTNTCTAEDMAQLSFGAGWRFTKLLCPAFEVFWRAHSKETLNGRLEPRQDQTTP